MDINFIIVKLLYKAKKTMKWPVTSDQWPSHSAAECNFLNGFTGTLSTEMKWILKYSHERHTLSLYLRGKS
jgi:hypothetical protein